MAAFGELVIVYDLLPELAARLEEAVSAVVRKAAFDVQAEAQSRAPVDTGFLKNSIYTVTDKGSTYGNISATPPGDSYLLPEVDHPSEPKTHAIVAVGANYGEYVEYGSEHGPAQPYLTPAAERVRLQFETALHHLEERMATGSTGE